MNEQDLMNAWIKAEVSISGLISLGMRGVLSELTHFPPSHTEFLEYRRNDEMIIAVI